jgi:hypothetical protein
VPLRQSVSSWHAFWLSHWGQLGPPQSTSVSPLFFWPSVQLTHVPASQRVLLQSSPVEHGPPSSQGGQARSVPQPSVVWPQVVVASHCVTGVQHVSWKHTSVAAQLPVQSNVPPQPSSKVAEHVVASHAVAAVQHMSW